MRGYLVLPIAWKIRYEFFVWRKRNDLMFKVKSNYDKRPYIEAKTFAHECWAGWENVARVIREARQQLSGMRKVVVMECYIGVADTEVLGFLGKYLQGEFVLAKHVMKSERKIREMVQPDVTG